MINNSNLITHDNGKSFTNRFLIERVIITPDKTDLGERWAIAVYTLNNSRTALFKGFETFEDAKSYVENEIAFDLKVMAAASK